jgi:hypothetical protein
MCCRRATIRPAYDGTASRCRGLVLKGGGGEEKAVERVEEWRSGRGGGRGWTWREGGVGGGGGLRGRGVRVEGEGVEEV